MRMFSCERLFDVFGDEWRLEEQDLDSNWALLLLNTLCLPPRPPPRAPNVMPFGVRIVTP